MPCREWAQVIQLLAHFTASLPLPAGCDRSILSQPLVLAVLKELGEESPENLLAKLLTDVRRCLVVGEAGGTP